MLPSCSTMPPISWTSKCRMPVVRIDASRTDRERLGQDLLQRLALGDSLLELDRLVGEFGVRELLHLRLQAVDQGHRPLVALDDLRAVVAKDAFQDLQSQRLHLLRCCAGRAGAQIVGSSVRCPDSGTRGR